MLRTGIIVLHLISDFSKSPVLIRFRESHQSLIIPDRHRSLFKPGTVKEEHAQAFDTSYHCHLESCYSGCQSVSCTERLSGAIHRGCGRCFGRDSKFCYVSSLPQAVARRVECYVRSSATIHKGRTSRRWSSLPPNKMILAEDIGRRSRCIVPVDGNP